MSSLTQKSSFVIPAVCLLTMLLVNVRAAEDSIDKDEARRLQVTTTPVSSESAKSPGKKFKLDIYDVELPAAYNRDFSNWPASVTSLQVEGNQFTRYGKPVFLMGLETTIAYPELLRLLGADFAHTQDTCAMGGQSVGKSGDTITTCWKPYELLQVQIPMFLSSGLALWIQPYEEKQDAYPGPRFLPFYEEFPELYVNASHYVSFRFDVPEGKRLRENMWRNFLTTTRAYPVFGYELFNEVRYMDYSPANLAGFRQAMGKKYGTIDSANAAWETSFPSFESVEPVRKTQAYGGTLADLKPRDFSTPLWVDWQKFIELTFAGHLGDVSRFVKSVDSNPTAYTTVQSVFDLPQGYQGGGGVYPAELVKQVDFLSAEIGGGIYIAQDNGDNYEEIKRMITSTMLGDLMAFISGGKPVIDVEMSVSGYGQTVAPEKARFNLAGQWKFQPDSADAGLAAGYEKLGYDDKKWTEIKVPGNWGPQGFPKATHGWYRRTVTIPESMRGTPLYLNGSTLADRARVYLNGHLVTRTREWNERFSVDVSDLLQYGSDNVITLAISNNYLGDGMYWGGIRDYVVLDTRPYSATVPMRANQMRSFFWEKIVHGQGGLVPSYAYAAEGDSLSCFNPKKVSWEAAAAMPATMREIGTIADIILPNNRKPASIALFYPFESGRARVAKDYQDWLKSPATRDLLDYYAALLFGPKRLDVVFNDALLDGRCDRYRVLFFRMSQRVRQGTIEKLDRYVREGGIVVMDHGSLSINDDSHQPLHVEALTGVTIGAPLRIAKDLKPSSWWESGTRTVFRQYDSVSGITVQPQTAQVVAEFADGTPAITRNVLGKGSVYYIAAELPEAALRSFTKRLLDSLSLPDEGLSLAPKPGQTLGRYIEARLFEHSGDRLAYIHNWGGGPVAATLKLTTLPEGRYRVRTLAANATNLKEELYTAADLRKGIALQIPAQDPLPLLIENENKSSRPLPGLNPKQRQLLSLMGPGPRGGTRALINASRGETMTKIRMLTAVRLLENEGFEVNTNLGELLPSLTTFTTHLANEDLSGYRVIVTLGSGIGDRKFTNDELKTLREYVVNGGGLLIAANQYVGPHWWFANSSAKGPLAELFGVGTTETNVQDENHCRGGVPSHPLLSAKVSSHPILTGVKTVQTLGSSILMPNNPASETLLVSSPQATPANASAAVALNFGKGRVVILGDAKWLQMETLSEADNAQFFVNLMKWLSGDDAKIEPLNREQIPDASF